MSFDNCLYFFEIVEIFIVFFFIVVDGDWNKIFVFDWIIVSGVLSLCDVLEMNCCCFFYEFWIGISVLLVRKKLIFIV